MIDDDSRHLPSAEFRASLEEEVARTLRNEIQFESSRPQRLRRLSVVIGLPVAAVLALTIGFVIGSNTTYALAETPGTTLHPPTATAMIRNALTVLTCGALASSPEPAAAQQPGIPIVNLPSATVKSSESFGAILGVRQSSDGSVLVNDAARHQLRLLDTTLATSTVVLDSVAGTANSYGSRPVPLNAYVGDSVLFADWNSRTILVLDGRGRMAHALAMPNPNNFGSIANGYVGVDGKGRLLFRTGRPRNPNAAPREVSYTDSVVILRADLDQRRVDTVGRIARPLMRVTTERGSDSKVWTIFTSDPFQAVDDWTVLSGGTTAFLRGHDYHIDWINSDGTAGASEKLPFDWTHLDEAAKERLSDSLRTAQNALLANGYPQGAEVILREGGSCDQANLNAPGGAGGGGIGAARTGRAGGGGGDAPPSNAPCTQINMNGIPSNLQDLPGYLSIPVRGSIPPLASITRSGPMADYLPPIGQSAVIADADDNLWILPRLSKWSQHGELVYDIVNAKGELFQRVRLPAGRAIAGFGKGGVVYLTTGDRTNGFYLERTRLPRKGAR